jgi:hypothetical protein
MLQFRSAGIFAISQTRGFVVLAASECFRRVTAYSHMKIPIDLETSTDFANRVAKLVSLDGTRVYVDTSFLMWLTKVGRTSRGQLFDWLAAECPGRVHVPVWAAHEYLRHHVAGTIVGELDRMAKELWDVANRTYVNLRPFLDDLIVPGERNAESQQVAARETLNELQALAISSKRWSEEYKEHAAQIINFINGHVPDKTPVFEYMSGIEAIGMGRFEARLPPGFQDRRKKAQLGTATGGGGSDDVLVGGNRWGDLIFWKEVLDHAADRDTKAIIILTNDRKNDWHMGGGGTEGVSKDLLELKSSWKPVPCAHPTLCLEARIAAGVEDVVLLDTPYLGALLRTLAGDSVKEFVDVAIVPDPPAPPTETARRKALLDDHLRQSEIEDAEKAAESGLRFLDSALVQGGSAPSMRALYESRGTLDEDEAASLLLHELEAAIERGESAANLLTKESVELLDNSMLATLARELHDRGLAGVPGYDEALTDLISLLNELPELTAASLYLGFIASMYLERPTNKPRFPPQSRVASLLLERQDAPYAAEPISALRKKFAKLERWPLYLLDVGRPPIHVHLDNAPGTPGEVVLNSVRLAGEEVFTRAQGNSDLRLAKLFEGRSELSGGEVVKSACEFFGVPFDQVTQTDDFDRLFSIDPTAGFKDPRSVYVDNEERA